jgi:hypothetical protein
LTQSPCGDPLFTQEEGEYGPHRLFTEQVRSQVVVDFERGIQANPDWAPPSSEVDLWKGSSDEFEDDFEAQDIRTDNLCDSRVSEEFLKREEFKRQRWNKGDEMPEGDDLLLLYCIPSLRRTLPNGLRLWYFHFARTSHPQYNWAVENRTRITSRRSPAIECTTLELIFFCFDLLVGQGSVKVGIGVTHRTVLQNTLLARKCSIGAKTQFASWYRPLPMTCSQPLSLHDRGDHLCRDGGAEGWYFERADRGAGSTHAPIFGA